jgi:hypothetical protein
MQKSAINACKYAENPVFTGISEAPSAGIGPATCGLGNLKPFSSPG